MFSVEIGQESYFVSVIQMAKGDGPQNPGEAYFAVLMKAYAEGSSTTLRSSRMTTWAGHTAMEGISDADSATHLIDMTAAGDRVYLVVFAGAKGAENEPRATRLRDSFKLLAP
jgi:predicted Zn-dependent protease